MPALRTITLCERPSTREKKRLAGPIFFDSMPPVGVKFQLAPGGPITKIIIFLRGLRLDSDEHSYASFFFYSTAGYNSGYRQLCAGRRAAGY